MTQTERLRAYLLLHPGASSLEIIRDLSVTNATGRISDLRRVLEPDRTVAREKRDDGRDGYWIRDIVPAQLRMAL